MCQHRSYIAVRRQDGDIDIYGLPNNDSHEEIRYGYGIRDGDVAQGRQEPIEVLPGDLTDPATWTRQHDGDVPAWWTERHTKCVLRRLAQDHREWWNPETRTYTFGGNLVLARLTSLPKGITFNVDGDLALHSFTSLPKGTTFNVSGSLHLRRLTSLPKGTTFNVDGDLALDSFTSLPKGVAEGVRGYIYLASGPPVPGKAPCGRKNDV